MMLGLGGYSSLPKEGRAELAPAGAGAGVGGAGAEGCVPAAAAEAALHPETAVPVPPLRRPLPCLCPAPTHRRAVQVREARPGGQVGRWPVTSASAAPAPDSQPPRQQPLAVRAAAYLPQTQLQGAPHLHVQCGGLSLQTTAAAASSQLPNPHGVGAAPGVSQRGALRLPPPQDYQAPA